MSQYAPGTLGFRLEHKAVPLSDEVVELLKAYRAAAVAYVDAIEQVAQLPEGTGYDPHALVFHAKLRLAGGRADIAYLDRLLSKRVAP